MKKIKEQWQISIIESQPQTIRCPFKKKISCMLTILSIACLKCENYPGAG